MRPEAVKNNSRAVAGDAESERVPARVGMRVSHPDFGEGVIESVLGNGENKEVQIRFAREGVKMLPVRSARIELMEDDIERKSDIGPEERIPF